jgi:hypothetical protein
LKNEENRGDFLVSKVVGAELERGQFIGSGMIDFTPECTGLG